MGRASATNNGRFAATKVDLSRVEAHNQAVGDRILGKDDSHWTVKLTAADRAEAMREARREVGLERCEWRREVVGWTDKRLVVQELPPATEVLEESPLAGVTAVEAEVVDDVRRPIYKLVEHWVPAD
jgi:hypothetical protein